MEFDPHPRLPNAIYSGSVRVWDAAWKFYPGQTRPIWRSARDALRLLDECFPMGLHEVDGDLLLVN
jgi:hypothetical protein